MKARRKLSHVPKRIQALPIDPKWNLPVPWFVQWVDGKPEFPIMDARKRHKAIEHQLCWICGQRLRVPFAFVIGPMCGVNRTSAEPPSHVTCAIYAAEHCPFLTTPKMKRMDLSHLPDAVGAPGVALKRNPGCCAVWVTKRFELISARTGFLIRIGEPQQVLWYAEGRKATRDEIMESIRTGLPFLMDVATQESPAAVAELERMTKVLERLLPR